MVVFLLTLLPLIIVFSVNQRRGSHTKSFAEDRLRMQALAKVSNIPELERLNLMWPGDIIAEGERLGAEKWFGWKWDEAKEEMQAAGLTWWAGNHCQSTFIPHAAAHMGPAGPSPVRPSSMPYPGVTAMASMMRPGGMGPEVTHPTDRYTTNAIMDSLRRGLITPNDARSLLNNTLLDNECSDCGLTNMHPMGCPGLNKPSSLDLTPEMMKLLNYCSPKYYPPARSTLTKEKQRIAHQREEMKKIMNQLNQMEEALCQTLSPTMKTPNAQSLVAAY